MKKALPTILGTVLGVVIAVPLTLFLAAHFLTSPTMRSTVTTLLTSAVNANQTPPAASASAGSFTPEGAALKQALLDDIAEMNKREFKPPPQLELMIQALTPADMQALLPIAAQESAIWQKAGTNFNPPRPKFDMNALRALSPQAMIAVSLVIAHEDRAGRKAQAKALENVPAVDLSGEGPPPGSMTAEQAAAYRQEAMTNTFQSPIPPANLPPILRLPHELDQTEDDWLSRLIVQDIVAQVIIGLHLKQPIAGVQPHIDFDDADPASGKILVHFMQWLDDPQMPGEKLNREIHLDFAWDGPGYSIVAETLCGSHPLPAPAPDPEAAHFMADLLDLNGPQLAREDVRLSALLQKNPLEASAQSEAALLLAALAWRENAGEFSDNRQLLCKATAHLALALALESLQKQSPDWNARVADIALRVLAGREADALPRLDALAAEPDVPDAAKTWLSTLRFWATGDWRQAHVDASSPTLVKIAWFQVLCADLSDLGATTHLDAAGELAKVPDWGRAILNHPFSVENGNRFAQATLALELQEASEVAQAENQPVTGDKALVAALASREDETVVVDQAGNPTIRVIGPGTFFAASQRHVLNAIRQTDHWLRDMLGTPDEAGQFEAQMVSTFDTLPHFTLVTYWFPNPDHSHHREIEEVLRGRGANWDVTELPPSPLFVHLFSDPADFRILSAFYEDGEPGGTVYDFPRRLDAIRLLNINPRWHLSPYAQSPAHAYDVKRIYFEALQGLDPDSCPLAETLAEAEGVHTSDPSGTQALATLKRFMDYCVSPFNKLLNAQPSYDFSNADEETILTKKAALEPDVYFQLGALLRKEGRADDAAEADRKGAAQAYDQVGVADSIQPLVEYDLAHGKSDEALALAKRAADVYSSAGIYAYMFVLEKLNRLDEAETWGKNMEDRYGYDNPLLLLYLGHPDHFHNQIEAVKKAYFPQGMITVSLNSFSGPPSVGATFTSTNPQLDSAGLEQGDIVVALNQTRIENVHQYDLIRGLISGPDMDLIVWHDGGYKEVHASPPNHIFGVDMNDYPIR